MEFKLPILKEIKPEKFNSSRQNRTNITKEELIQGEREKNLRKIGLTFNFLALAIILYSFIITPNIHVPNWIADFAFHSSVFIATPFTIIGIIMSQKKDEVRKGSNGSGFGYSLFIISIWPLLAFIIIGIVTIVALIVGFYIIAHSNHD